MWWDERNRIRSLLEWGEDDALDDERLRMTIPYVTCDRRANFFDRPVEMQPIEQPLHGNGRTVDRSIGLFFLAFAAAVLY